jgi:hypothetical protein
MAETTARLACQRMAPRANGTLRSTKRSQGKIALGPVVPIAPKMPARFACTGFLSHIPLGA